MALRDGEKGNNGVISGVNRFKNVSFWVIDMFFFLHT